MRFSPRAALLLPACALFAISCQSAPPPSTPESPKPQYGTWGYDEAGADKATKPGNDFYRSVNGAWIDHTEIPADKAMYSLRMAMTDRVEDRLHELLEQSGKTASATPADTDGKAGAFYRSFMDEARVEKLGTKPLEPELSAIRNAATRDDLAALMGKTTSSFHDSLFAITIDADLKDPKHYAVYLAQAGLGLPDRDYYLEPGFAAQKKAYEHYAATLLHLIDWPDADARARDIVDFETAIARVSWTNVQDRDLNAIYNPLTIPELGRLAPTFPWKAFLASANLAAIPRVVVSEKSAFPKIAAIFADTSMPILKAWSAFRAADNTSQFLPGAFVDARFEMHDHTLLGNQALAPRWRRGVNMVGGLDALSSDRNGVFGTMGFAVGQMYTTKYFPPEAKANIESLVVNLKAAFRARIEHLDWMSAATKTEALKKLDTYQIKVGYPDHPRDYSKLVIDGNDLVGNVRRAGANDWAFYVSRLSGPVDRSDWAMTPQTNDAYNGSLRDIVFPAGILQPPIFDAAADPAINYGAAGAIIGHELTHGFDDQGRKIDADGALRDWWTAADAKEFEARAAALSKQYSQFEPLPGVHVNGDLTNGENIADLGGVTLALDAYRASLGGKPAPVIGGLTGDQRVMIGWAQAWRGRMRDEAIKHQVASDPHSPRMFRVNGVVRNIDAWYDAFDVKPGEALFTQPNQRVHIW